jgi:hypothetical protein
MGAARHKEPFRILKPKMGPRRPTLRDGWYWLIELDIPRPADSRALCSKRNNSLDVSIRLHQAETERL